MRKKDMPKVTIHTDGSRRKYGGYAGVMECENHHAVVYGNQPNATSNVMELQAPIACLEKLKQPCNVTLISDSEYVVKGLNSYIKNWQKNGWRTKARQPVANQEHWERLSELTQEHKIKVKWVRSHNGNVANETADYFAGIAADGKI